MTGNSPEADNSKFHSNLNSDPGNGDFEELQGERDINIGVEHSEDEETNEPNGYELLPASADNAEEEDEDDKIEFGYSSWDGGNFQTTTSNNYRDLVHNHPLSERSQSPDRSSSIPLNTDQIEEIKSIMSNISIPSTAIPSWATSVTDDELKKALDEKVVKKN